MGELEQMAKDMPQEKNKEDLEIVKEGNVKEELKKQKTKLDLKLVSSNKIWNNIAKRVDGIREDFVLEMTKEGFRIKQTDEGNVIMLDETIPKSAFDEYKVSHNIKIGINTTRLKKHLKIYSKDITVTNGQNKLIFKGEKGQHSKMGLIQISDLDMDLPQIDYDVELKTPAKAIQKMITVGEDFDREELKFRVKEKLFYIFVEGETDEVRFPICKVNHLSDKKDFKTLYSIEYLKTVMKFKDKDEIVVKFGEDTPINIIYDEKDEKVELIVAPRIESE